MFSGVCFTIKMSNGSVMTPAYEVHTTEGLSNIITQTYALCKDQGASVWAVNVA